MKKKILIVDDNDYITKTLKLAIEKEAFEVIGINNPSEALDWLQSNHPNLIVTDLNMPKINGFELIAEIRANEGYKNIPILVLTTSHESKEKVRAAGANGFITKPFSTRKLISIVKELTND